MKISYRWLGRHIDLDGISPEEVANDLTLSTAEVEGVERWAPHLSDVIVGHVTQREQHPNADRLSVCQVDVGTGDALNIVCGAPNVDAGQKVAVARVGTVLPGDLKLKRSKIRGVESQGMICSVRELELGDDHDGIWVLPDDVAIGQPVAEALDAVDWIIEIDNKSLTHRPDLWGHRGIASELSAIYRRPLIELDASLPAAPTTGALSVDVQDGDCRRYLAIGLAGIENGPSPDWMKRLLLAVGQRPIDLCVDVSNFVMLDLGQPNHLFDRRQISPEGIRVRAAREAERLTTLDESERVLGPTDLLICSGDEPVALAGIMGGSASMVQPDTCELLLEVANFDPARVRRTSARLALRTDSSARFEKSLDPTLCERAAGHLVRTLQSIQPGVRIDTAVTDAGQWTDPSRTIELKPERVRALLGIAIDNGDIADILTRLGFGVEQTGELLTVRVPAARATKDVTIPEDLVEEVGRIWRYGNVPEARVRGELLPAPTDPRRSLVRRVADRLAGAARFQEQISYSFHTDELLSALSLDSEPHVRARNPVAEGVSAIRRSVAPSLVQLLASNLRHQDEVRLFEIGKGYRPGPSSERGEPCESHELALVWAAPTPGRKARFDAGRLLAVRGLIEDLMRGLDLEAPTVTAAEDLPPWANPARGLALQAEQAGGGRVAVGRIFQLDPGVARTLGVEAEVGIAELSIDALLRAAPRGSAYRPLPKFPGVKVDVALSLPTAVTADEVGRAIDQAGKGLVRWRELFDVYAGEAVGAGRRSLAWHVLLQAADKTLSDKETHKFLGRLERLIEGLGGELRKD